MTRAIRYRYDTRHCPPPVMAPSHGPLFPFGRFFFFPTKQKSSLSSNLPFFFFPLSLSLSLFQPSYCFTSFTFSLPQSPLSKSTAPCGQQKSWFIHALLPCLACSCPPCVKGSLLRQRDHSSSLSLSHPLAGARGPLCLRR